MKYELNEHGIVKYPEYIGKKLALSTWKRTYKVFEYYLNESYSGKTVSQIVLESATQYIWDAQKKPDAQYKTKFHGLSRKKSEWQKLIGYKYVRALIDNKTLIEVKK